MPTATTAIEMRKNFGQEAESLPPTLESLFNQLLQLKLTDLGKDMIKNFSPATIALFAAIKAQLDTAQTVLIEQLTADDNFAQFTAGTENGIAANMPTELVPLVIATLAKISAISHRAHLNYEKMKNQLPTMLLQLKETLIRQAIIDHDLQLQALKKRQAALETAQRQAAISVAELSHDPQQQLNVKQRTQWLKTTLQDLKAKIKDKQTTLRTFIENSRLFETGATQLQQPVL